jgi:hypothetical protein
MKQKEKKWKKVNDTFSLDSPQRNMKLRKMSEQEKGESIEYTN